MMMKDKGKLVIWPVYLDQTKSRSSGRIISRKNAIKEPQLNEIKEAARQLGLDPEVEPEKAYPKSWWEVSGRVLVDDKGPKSVIAKQIASAIKKMRGQETPVKTAKT
jgi:signal recognition particle subunit SRP19